MNYRTAWRKLDCQLKKSLKHYAEEAHHTAINVADKKKYGHPTIKPEEIIENLILNSSEAGG